MGKHSSNPKIVPRETNDPDVLAVVGKYIKWTETNRETGKIDGFPTKLLPARTYQESRSIITRIPNPQSLLPTFQLNPKKSRTLYVASNLRCM